MNVSIIGAGRVATHLSLALKSQGHELTDVYSRTIESAAALASKVGARATCRLETVSAVSDVYIISVKDDALPEVISRLCPRLPGKLFVHTAGSVSMSVFEGLASHYGVIYPMQTFSMSRQVDMREVPLFVESGDPLAGKTIGEIARSLSGKVTEMSSEDRKHLHLAAVFACNFANFCFQMSQEVLEGVGVSFDTMLPLIRETVGKLSEMSPRQAQTGPAVRYDQTVIAAHLKLLSGDAFKQEVYKLMSEGIHLRHSDS